MVGGGEGGGRGGGKVYSKLNEYLCMHEMGEGEGGEEKRGRNLVTVLQESVVGSERGGGRVVGGRVGREDERLTTNCTCPVHQGVGGVAG